MTTIGVVSDTHVKEGGKRVLAPQLFEIFQNVDLILHAGDINTMQVISDLETLAPVCAVFGNNCDWGVLQSAPQTRLLKIENARIGLAHGDVAAEGANIEVVGFESRTAACALSHFQDVDCVVFGHTHRPLIEWITRADGKQILLFNPGSAGKKRGAPHLSCGILRVDGKHLEAELQVWE